MKNNPTLVDRLEELNSRGIRKSDMARIAGITPQAVNGWYRQGAISKKSALALCEVAGVSMQWLMGIEEEERGGLTASESNLLGLYRQMPENEREKMLRLVSRRVEELASDDLYSRYFEK